MMGSFSIWHWLIVAVVVAVLFGGKGKLSSVMGLPRRPQDRGSRRAQADAARRAGQRVHPGAPGLRSAPALIIRGG